MAHRTFQTADCHSGWKSQVGTRDGKRQNSNKKMLLFWGRKRKQARFLLETLHTFSDLSHTKNDELSTASCIKHFHTDHFFDSLKLTWNRKVSNIPISQVRTMRLRRGRIICPRAYHWDASPGPFTLKTTVFWCGGCLTLGNVHLSELQFLDSMALGS